MIKLALSVGITWTLVNVLKPIIILFKEKKISRETIIANGGMPSGHTSLVVSLAAGVFLGTGFSPCFMIALVLAAVVIYDAIKVRTLIGQQARLINNLLKNQEDFTALDENVGHTPAEVLVSVILGIIIPLLVYTL